VKVIRKGKEPRSLTEYRAVPAGTSYESFPAKQELRESLAREQASSAATAWAVSAPTTRT